MYVWIVRTGWGVTSPFFQIHQPTVSEIEAEFNIYGERRHHHDWEISGPFDIWVMNTIENIDYDLLRKQKESLITAICCMEYNKELTNHLEGVLGLIDSIQDEMAKYLGEERVFGPVPGTDYKFTLPGQSKRPARKLNIQR